jgi:hypothetical protein
MSSNVVAYLAARGDAATFLLPAEFDRTIAELFPRGVLPEPTKIFPADETQPASLGFPLLETNVIKDLDARLDRWLTDEVAWQVTRGPAAKEKAQISLAAYTAPLLKLAENALLSNVLGDYHGVFWLAHSFDLARQFCALPRRVSLVDTQAGRAQGDALKYRILQRWSAETREGMSQVSARAAATLDGEEQRALQFFRLLQEDVLILTEEFIGPDLRELRSFITGYLRRDFQQFRDGFERLRSVAAELLTKERAFRAALPLFGATAEQGITLALLLDPRFQSFLFEQPSVQNMLSREDREQFQLIAKRLREFAVLNQLRRAVQWMSVAPDGRITSSDKRLVTAYSRSTRPLDFGRQGIVDPVVHRFGLIYDISAFTETLGNIRRGGRKEEVSSYRQMLLFQRRLESIGARHLLQFEKFLGDGAFYTTRRALRLVRAAVEIQRYYSEVRRGGFVFNKGLRIACNFGYYRLLPMKAGEDGQRITEFYGPGIVELSRLTTGKANKEIEDVATLLVAHGYDQSKVQQFFAPLARGVDVIDHTQHAREFYAYVNANGHLINEGIVASFALLQELSNELTNEGQKLYRLRAAWGTYIGFEPGVPGVEFLGVRLVGMVSLKGLDNIDVGEIAPFAPGEVDATPLEPGESLTILLRQEFHQKDEDTVLAPRVKDFSNTTTESMVAIELVICVKPSDEHDEGEVLIGEWDPLSDDVHRPLLMPRGDFEKLFSLKGELTTEMLDDRKSTVRELYDRLSDRASSEALQLATYRAGDAYVAYVLGDVVEKL